MVFRNHDIRRLQISMDNSTGPQQRHSANQLPEEAKCCGLISNAIEEFSQRLSWDTLLNDAESL